MLSLLMSVLAPCLLLFTVVAQAQELDPAYYYRLTTQWQGDGKSLDIINDGQNNKPILAPTGNYSGQMWKLTKLTPVAPVVTASPTLMQPTWTPLSAKGTSVGVGANGVLWVIATDPAGAADKSMATYGRGVGQIPACGSGLQSDAGLCYNACPRDFDGVGPVCWGKCPADFPAACGAGCAVSKEACGAAVTEMTLETVSVAVNLLTAVVGAPGVTAAAKTAAKAGATAAGKVAANNAATTECQLVPGAEESVNVSSLAGVWAWKDDQSQKFVINYDSTFQSFRGNGRVVVVDPIKRVYNLAIGAEPPVTITLAADHDKFTFPATGTFAGTSAARRPWDARCNPGETFFVGLCYDIPVGYEPTAPGFMGKPCPSGWRDDGVQCYPPWTGPAVAFQADPDGTLPMQRPILVTDCTKFSQAQGQKCPVHFTNTGGPLGCTCEAQPTSKEVKSIIGKMPSSR